MLIRHRSNFHSSVMVKITKKCIWSQICGCFDSSLFNNTFSTAYITWNKTLGWSVSDEMERAWKKAVVWQFKVLYQCVLGWPMTSTSAFFLTALSLLIVELLQKGFSLFFVLQFGSVTDSCKAWLTQFAVSLQSCICTKRCVWPCTEGFGSIWVPIYAGEKCCVFHCHVAVI